MPVYIYKCEQPNCETEFEKNVAISDRDGNVNCPECGTHFFVKRKIVFTGSVYAPTAGGMR